MPLFNLVRENLEHTFREYPEEKEYFKKKWIREFLEKHGGEFSRLYERETTDINKILKILEGEK